MKQSKFLLVTIILIALLTICNDNAFSKPPSTGPVQVIGRDIYVDGQKYLIKGVGYQPAPVGEYPGQSFPYDTRLFERDFPLLNSMGSNTIRTWTKVTPVLMDYAARYGLKVNAGFWVDINADLTSPSVRQNILNEFRQYVTEIKDYSSLLNWSIGNEQNYHNGHTPDWYSLVNEMGGIAYEVEGSGYHPVSVVNGSLHNIGDASKLADDGSLGNVDIWGTNVYTGVSFYQNPDFGDYFAEYANRSGKPLWISEYGADAWHTNDQNDPWNGYEDQQTQAEWGRNQWVEIALSGIAIGGSVMAYSDEWWKTGFLNSQTPYGLSTLPFGHILPDDYANESYWGIMSIVDNGSAPDIMVPRQIYYDLYAPIPEPSTFILMIFAAPLLILTLTRKISVARHPAE